MMFQKMGFGGHHLVCLAKSTEDAVPTIVEHDRVVLGAGALRLTLSRAEVHSLYRMTFGLDWPLPGTEG